MPGMTAVPPDDPPCEPDAVAAAPGLSIAVPLFAGVAILVGVIFAIQFFRQGSEGLSVRSLEEAKTAIRNSLGALKRNDCATAETEAERAITAASIPLESGRQGIDEETLALAYLCRAEARAGLGATEALKRAIEDYTRCLERTPEEILAFYGRGQVHFRLGQTREAERDFTEAIARNKNYAPAYAARALTRKRLKNFEGARTDEAQARALAP